jgi:hypothetical protein
MNISQTDAFAVLQKWRDEQQLVRIIYAVEHGGLTIIGQVTGLNDSTFQINGHDSELVPTLPRHCRSITRNRGKLLKMFPPELVTNTRLSLKSHFRTRFASESWNSSLRKQTNSAYFYFVITASRRLLYPPFP